MKPKEKVQGLTGVVVTTTPGEVSIDRPITIEFYNRNSNSPQTFQAQPGDIIYLLTYHGEGEFLAWVKGRFMNVDVWGLVDDRNIRRGKSIWWVKIKNSQGQIGWTDQSNHFDNQQQG